jgi:hypothetical protein
MSPRHNERVLVEEFASEIEASQALEAVERQG